MQNVLRNAMAALYLAVPVAPAVAGVAYDETGSGDLSGTYSSPTPLAVSLGSNLVYGTTGKDATSNQIDRDYFTVTIPPGQRLTALKILPGTQPGGTFGSFIGLRAGAAATDPTAPQTTQAADLLGYTLYGPADIDQDILGRMGGSNSLTPPAQGFTAPLSAGTYTFWIQEGAVGSYAYAVDVQVDSVPAPTPTTKIEHLIVIVGENVTFDTLYGAYQPQPGQVISNLLSQRIVNADGTPGPKFARARQRRAQDQGGEYQVQPPRAVRPYAFLPQPLKTGIVDLNTGTFAGGEPDPRFPAKLPNGPFQITQYVPYGSANSNTGDPAHRFFQMWQQTGGDNAHPDLFAWVATTAGTGGDNGTTGPTPANPQQGGELMGFFNMAQGDAPYFKYLADNFALSDNYHQAIMGGTGANFFALATGDAAVYNLGGALATPFANQIENPNPQAGTANFYTQDGYKGGSYVNCADAGQPGVAPILAVLAAKGRASRCEPGAYYLVNNYDPPFNIDGSPKALGADKFVYPPQSVPTIGEALSAGGVSWKWYTGGRDAEDVLNDPLYGPVHQLVDSQVPQGIPNRDQIVNGLAFSKTQGFVYNSIGDPLNASANVVGNPSLFGNLKGLNTFYGDVGNGTLPAVSFVVPKNLSSGHPGYSVPALYEQFVADLVSKVTANPEVWAKTAIIVTTDEGGGYFDTGYIQNLDFFGDGPRIPMLVVSPYAKKGYVDHIYHDHASILKFIERNWSLPPLSARSRDNLPNPEQKILRYRPANEPAVGDLMTLFKFK